MDVAIVGAGRVGTAVGVLLRRAGHRITAASGGANTRGRVASYLDGVPVLEPIATAAAGDLVLVAVPDDAIQAVVAQIASAGGFREGQWAAHLSGATPLAALDAARGAGARRLSIHPLQTFPDVAGAIDRLPGCAIAIAADDEEGFGLGERIADDLGGEPFRLSEEMRALYHAAAVFASNYLVGISAVAERLFARAGLPDPARAMQPLQRATLDNVARMGSADALTGPAARGDAVTVERNLDALAAHAPDVVPSYVELCRVLLDLASRGGRLPADRRAVVEEVLSRWT